MNIKQISVFLENKSGRLADVMKVLANGGINIKALSLADTKDFGVLRLIVNNPDLCIKVLKENEFVAQETNVIGIEIEDKPGGLYKVLQVIEKNKINVEYMYATVQKNRDNAIVMFRVDDNEKAIEILKQNHVPLINSEAFLDK